MSFFTVLYYSLTPTQAAWPLRGHTALKLILWETLFLDKLHDFSLLSSNSFFTHFWNQNSSKKFLQTKKFFKFHNTTSMLLWPIIDVFHSNFWFRLELIISSQESKVESKISRSIQIVEDFYYFTDGFVENKLSDYTFCTN